MYICICNRYLGYETVRITLKKLKKLMKITQETLESFPANCNPFHHDEWNMGTRIGKSLMMMHANHADEEMHFMIIVNTETGARVKLTIEEEGRAAKTPLCDIMEISHKKKTS
jgi:hypothetical protein